MLGEYEAQGDSQMVKRLQACLSAMTMPLPAAYDRMRNDAMHGVGIITTRDMKSVEAGIFFPSWFSKKLTFGDKISLWRGKIYYASKLILINEVFSTNLRKKVISLDLPVYFFS